MPGTTIDVLRYIDYTCETVGTNVARRRTYVPTRNEPVLTNVFNRFNAVLQNIQSAAREVKSAAYHTTQPVIGVGCDESRRRGKIYQTSEPETEAPTTATLRGR